MATTNNSKNKITKSQRFADIIHILRNEKVEHGTTLEEGVAVIAHEIELLSNKNGSMSKKKQAQAEADAGYMADILDYLATIDNDDGMTCTDIGREVSSCVDFSTSKMSSLCNKLVEEGKLTKKSIKSRSYFSLA